MDFEAGVCGEDWRLKKIDRLGFAGYCEKLEHRIIGDDMYDREGLRRDDNNMIMSMKISKVLPNELCSYDATSFDIVMARSHVGLIITSAT